MADALCLFVVLAHEVGGFGQFGQKIVEIVDLSHHFEQKDEGGQGEITRCAIFELMDGRQTDARQFRHFLLGQVATHPIVLEARA